MNASYENQLELTAGVSKLAATFLDIGHHCLDCIYVVTLPTQVREPTRVVVNETRHTCQPPCYSPESMKKMPSLTSKPSKQGLSRLLTARWLLTGRSVIG
eukprot:5973857-Amphidinium_carterae.1